MNIYRKLFALVIAQLLMLFSLSTESVAIDMTDTTPPIYAISLVQGLPAPGNAMILNVKTTDEKNEITTPLATAFPAWILYQGKVSVSPICSEGSQGRDEIIGQIVPLEMQSNKNASGSYERNFYLILHISKPKPLPDACPEWRDSGLIVGIERILNSFIKDAAGNSLRLSGGSVSGSFLNFQTKLIGDSRYCYLMLNTDEWLNDFTSVSELYQSKIAPYKDSVFAKEIFQRIESQYPYIKHLENYLKFTKQNYNLNEFRTLPLCPQVSNPAEHRQPLSFGAINSIVKPQVEAIASEIIQEKQKYQSRNTKKRSTIICVKGKRKKEVTAVKPKCPTGFKKI